jgi:hypothetical protein
MLPAVLAKAWAKDGCEVECYSLEVGSVQVWSPGDLVATIVRLCCHHGHYWEAEVQALCPGRLTGSALGKHITISFSTVKAIARVSWVDYVGHPVWHSSLPEHGVLN